MRELLSAGCYALFIITGVLAFALVTSAVSDFIHWIRENHND